MKPTLGPALDRPISIASGLFHLCAVLKSGAVFCWGRNDWGETGSDSPDKWSLVQVADVAGAVAVGTGREHSCALLGDGAVWCWGRNGFFQLGSTRTSPPTPGWKATPVVQNAPAVGISAGAYHTCILIAGGKVQCWGRNSNGQIGNGQPSAFESSPATVVDLEDVTAVSAGETHSCAVKTDGSAHCWGSNADGQLGIPLQRIGTDRPVAVADLPPVTDILAFSAGTCAVENASGLVYCWGRLTRSDTPVQMGIVRVISMTAGINHVCAIVSGGPVYCWGNNDFGQLGNGTTVGSMTPVAATLPGQPRQ